MLDKIKRLALSIILLVLFLYPFSSYPQSNLFNKWYPLPSHSDSGIFGGYVRALAIDPTNSQIIYAGTKGGGMFRSNNGGNHWNEINNGLDNKNILSIGVDRNNIVYVGTENGIFRSINNGNSWESIGRRDYQVNAIAVDPENSNIVYIATERAKGVTDTLQGIWRYDSEQNLWTQFKLRQVRNYNTPVDVYSINIYYNKDLKDKKIYVGTSNGTWISYDGISWPNSSNDNNLWPEQVSSLVFKPTNPRIVYAGTKRGVLFFSEDSGYTWIHTDTLMFKNSITCLAINSQNIFIGTEGSGLYRKKNSIYDNERYKVKLSDNEIYSVQINPDNPDIIYCATSGGVYLSSDNGEGFQKIVTGMTSTQNFQLLINPSDHKRFIAATSNGGFLSTNGGWSWKEIKDLPSKKILSLAVHPDKNNECYAGVFSDSVYFSNDYGQTWNSVKPPNSKTVWSVYSMAIAPAELSDKLLCVGSSDGIYLYTDYNAYPRLAKATSDQVSVLYYNSQHSDSVYAGTKDGKFYIGSGKWESWVEATKNLPPNIDVNDILILPDKNKLLIGTSNGFYSNNTRVQYEWQEDNGSFVIRPDVIKIVLDPLHVGFMYIVVKDEGIFRSYDFGQNWQSFNEGIEDYRFITSFLTLQPDSTQFIFASTQGKGIFKFHAAPVIDLIPYSLPFDTVMLNQEAFNDLAVRNIGELSLTIDSVWTTAPVFLPVLVDTFLFPREETQFTMKFSPDTIKSYNEILHVSSNAINTDSVFLKGIGGAAFISIDSNKINFGPVPIDTNKTIKIQITNSGNVAIKLVAKSLLNSGGFRILYLPATIYPNSSIIVEIEFNPKKVTSYEETFLLYSQYGEIFLGENKIFLEGEGDYPIPPALEIDPGEADFKTVSVGKRKKKNLTLTNIGKTTLVIDRIQITYPFLSYMLEHDTINSGDYSQLEITFSPDSIDTLNSAYLIIHSNAFNERDSIRVLGTGTAAFLDVDSTNIKFPITPVGKSSDNNIWIKNIGNEAFEFNTRFGADSKNFSISPESGTIAIGTAASFLIRFYPQSHKSYIDSLIFLHASGNIFFGDSIIHVEGEGFSGPIIALSDTHHIFNPILPDHTDEWSFFISNTGNDTLIIFDIFPKYTNIFIPAPKIAKIPPDSSKEFKLIFSSESVGEFNDTLIINSNALYGDSTISLSGECVDDVAIIVVTPRELNFDLVRVNTTKVMSFFLENTGARELIIDSIYCNNPSIEIEEIFNVIPENTRKSVNVHYTPKDTSTLNDTIKIVAKDVVGWNKVTVMGQGVAPVIAMDDTIDFGAIFKRSTSEKPLFIKNMGTDTLEFTIEKGGDDPRHFDFDNEIYPLPPDSTKKINITFTPDETREFSAWLKLKSDLFYYGDSIVHLIGDCFYGPVIEIIPDEGTLDSIRVGKSKDKIFEIRNTGAGYLVIKAVNKKFNTPDTIYQVQYNTNPIDTNKSEDMIVTFSPKSNKEYNETLTITCNAVFGDTIIPLTDQGIAPLIRVLPESLNFGSVHPGEIKSESFTIKNVGNDTLELINVKIDKYNDVFKIDSCYSFPMKIKPDSIIRCSINFAPSFLDTYKTNMVILSDAFNNMSYPLFLQGICEDKKPPKIEHTPLKSIEIGEPLIVTARITDPISGVEEGRIKYIKGGENLNDPSFKMHNSSPDSFWYIIPGDFITSKGIMYVIFARDSVGNVSDSTFKIFYSVPVNISEEGEFYPYNFEMDIFQLFSIPVLLNDPSPVTVLLDDFGDYDENEWVLADYKYPNREYPDCYVILNKDTKNDISSFDPGKAFFLNIKNQNKIIDTGPGKTVDLSRPYAIELQEGWNLIGNPFNFDIPQSQLILKSGKSILLWTCDRKWDTLGTTGNEMIHPWKGYAFYNAIPSETLLFYPEKHLLDSVITFQPFKDNSAKFRWKIQIIVKCGEAIDSLNYVGVFNEAADGYDANDFPEPPAIGNFVMLNIPHNNWDENSNTYTIDIQSVSNKGNLWNFNVLTNIPKSEVKLEFIGVNLVTDSFNVQLIDRDLKIAKKIDDSQIYSFLSGNEIISKRQFRLIVGNDDFISNNNDDISVIPDEYYLSQNFPNPFNPSTSIYYNLTEMTTVNIQIYNILGQVVKTLVDDELKIAGTHVLIWDGTDTNNIPVTSGLYLCKMKCKNFEKTRKLILLK